jgi:RNHCP domain
MSKLRVRRVHGRPGHRAPQPLPDCLWSRHVDDVPGDRAADCGSSMEPVAVCVRRDGEWLLVHRCTGCGTVHLNRIAGDDNPLPLMQLAVGWLGAAVCASPYQGIDPVG